MAQIKLCACLLSVLRLRGKYPGDANQFLRMVSTRSNAVCTFSKDYLGLNGPDASAKSKAIYLGVALCMYGDRRLFCWMWVKRYDLCVDG